MRAADGVVLIRECAGASAVAMDSRGPGRKGLKLAGLMPETEYPERERAKRHERRRSCWVVRVDCLAAWLVGMFLNGSSERPARSPNGSLGQVLSEGGWLVTAHSGDHTRRMKRAFLSCPNTLAENTSLAPQPPPPPPSLFTCTHPSALLPVASQAQTADPLHLATSTPIGHTCTN